MSVEIAAIRFDLKSSIIRAVANVAQLEVPEFRKVTGPSAIGQEYQRRIRTLHTDDEDRKLEQFPTDSAQLLSLPCPLGEARCSRASVGHGSRALKLLAYP